MCMYFNTSKWKIKPLFMLLNYNDLRCCVPVNCFTGTNSCCYTNVCYAQQVNHWWQTICSKIAQLPCFLCNNVWLSDLRLACPQNDIRHRVNLIMWKTNTWPFYFLGRTRMFLNLLCPSLEYLSHVAVTVAHARGGGNS